MEDGTVRIDRTGEHVARGPRYDPDVVSDPDAYRDDYGEAYRYDGISPSWYAGYTYPAFRITGAEKGRKR